MRFLILSAIIFLLSCGYEGHVNTGPVTIEGKVMWDGSDRGIPGVEVIAIRYNSFISNDLMGWVETDSNGEYAIHYEKYISPLEIKIQNSSKYPLERISSLGDTAFYKYYNPPPHIWHDFHIRAEGFLDISIMNNSNTDFKKGRISGSLGSSVFSNSTLTDARLLKVVAEKLDSIIIELKNTEDIILNKWTIHFQIENLQIEPLVIEI